MLTGGGRVPAKCVRCGTVEFESKEGHRFKQKRARLKNLENTADTLLGSLIRLKGCASVQSEPPELPFRRWGSYSRATSTYRKFRAERPGPKERRCAGQAASGNLFTPRRPEAPTGRSGPAAGTRGRGRRGGSAKVGRLCREANGGVGDGGRSPGRVM